MTNADVARVVEQAAAKGRTITTYDAAAFLGAKELLVKSPNDGNALIVVANFMKFLDTGIESVSFAEFSLPVPYTDEELAEQAASRDAFVAATRGTQL